MRRELKEAGGGLFDIDIKSSPHKQIPSPIDPDYELDIVRFPCCNETIKVNRENKLFCIICGADVDIQMSDAKKIFLSHKGVDKSIVRNFKKTLMQLGFEPWIDEDAMPAGTQLERGILQGMKDSCAAIFFVTPSFVDEGYLESEVNYAMAEKRVKNDKFSIISIQFTDSEGKSGDIPELLRAYVWKKPDTELEALREIVRALPIEVGSVDWRSSISGVVTLPQTSSTIAKLSEEAIAILKAAVEGGGSIHHSVSSGGEQLYSGRESMISDPNDARTIAIWIGGLEDLQKRRFVKPVGHKGEMFDVTREGFKEADEMKNRLTEH